MNDITIQSLGTIVGLAAFVTLAMTFVKPMLWPDGGAIQDRFAPVVAILIAIVLAILVDIVLPDADPTLSTEAKVATDVLNGIIAGVLSVGAYTATKRAVGR